MNKKAALGIAVLILVIIILMVGFGGCFTSDENSSDTSDQNDEEETCDTCGGTAENECGATSFENPDFSDTPREDETECIDDTDCINHGPAGMTTCCISDGTCY